MSGDRYSGDRLGFHVEIEGDKRHQPLVIAFRYSVGNGTPRPRCLRRLDDKKKFELKSRQYKLVRHPGRAWPLPEPQRFYGYPSRLYLWSGEIPEHVGIKGEKTIEAILASQDRTFNLKPRERKKTLAELVADRLRAMRRIAEEGVSEEDTALYFVHAERDPRPTRGT